MLKILFDSNFEALWTFNKILLSCISHGQLSPTRTHRERRFNMCVCQLFCTANSDNAFYSLFTCVQSEPKLIIIIIIIIILMSSIIKHVTQFRAFFIAIASCSSKLWLGSFFHFLICVSHTTQNELKRATTTATITINIFNCNSEFCNGQAHFRSAAKNKTKQQKTISTTK